MTAVAICTDSSAQLTAPLAARTRATVVPMSVAIDDRVVDEPAIDVDAFYALLAAGAEVTTSQPSPARFAEAYAAAAAGGADEIVSIHLGAGISGTVRSAELATLDAPIPVRVIDTGTASFGVGICVLAAADVLAEGGSAADVAAAIGRLVPRIGNVFVADPPTRGRLTVDSRAQILSLVGAETESLGPVTSSAGAVATMAEHIRGLPGRPRVGVGHASASVAAAADALAAALTDVPGLGEVVRYRVGPSVGAHTGAASFGAFWWPR